MTLREIEAEVRRLAARIGAPRSILPSFGRQEEDAHPHVEVDERGHHYVVVERGKENERFSTHNSDELLYKIFEGVTARLAQEEERRHRLPDQDFRRQYFHRQVELFSVLSPHWAERQAERHARILRDYPYDDHAIIRADLCVAYRNHGHSPEEAWKLSRRASATRCRSP